MKLIVETIQEVRYVTEEKNGIKSLFIEGPFLVFDQPNRNGRMYESKRHNSTVEKYIKEYVDAKRAFGELGHPDSPSINLDRVSHLITSLKNEGSCWIGKAKILETPMGKIAKSLMEGGATLGVSSRGMGSLKNKNGINVVQDDYYLATAADIVADPSAPGAFVQGIMEGKEFYWENGIIVAQQLADEAKSIIKRSKQRQLEDVALKIFENYIEKLKNGK